MSKFKNPHGSLKIQLRLGLLICVIAAILSLLFSCSDSDSKMTSIGDAAGIYTYGESSHGIKLTFKIDGVGVAEVVDNVYYDNMIFAEKELAETTGSVLTVLQVIIYNDKHSEDMRFVYEKMQIVTDTIKCGSIKIMKDGSELVKINNGFIVRKN